MANPFASLFQHRPKADSQSFHNEVVDLFRFTMDMEEANLPSVLLPNMVESGQLQFNSDNLEEAIIQRADLEGPQDYFLGGTNIPRSGDDWLLHMVKVIFETKSTIKFAAERALGAAVGYKMESKRFLAVSLYNAAVASSVDSGLTNTAASWAINVAASYGPPNGIRFVCSSFSLSISNTSLMDTSLELFKASEIFSSVYSMRSLLEFALSNPNLCPFRKIFSKNPFPSNFEMDSTKYPFFKDFDKCFKTQTGLEEEVGVIRHTLGLFTQNLHRMIKLALQDNLSRSYLLRILFNILSDNKEEGNTASTIRNPMGQLSIRFAQSLSITSLLLQVVKSFNKKFLNDLNLNAFWCFSDQLRYNLFKNQTTLQPNQERPLPNVDVNQLIFSSKEESYSTLFWLLHLSIRQSLHPVISQFNSQTRHIISQLQDKMKSAERDGDQEKYERAKMQLHYLNNKIYTLNAILMEPGFKFACNSFFHLTMKFMINVTEDNPYALADIPEFVIENINDVMGQLSRYEKDFLAESVDEDFLHTAYRYIVLYMKGSTYAFNPHLRKDLGPLLNICCPFDTSRSGDGNSVGSVITMAGQLRYSALNNFEDKHGLVEAIIGVFCDCEKVTDDDGFDSKFMFRRPFYIVLRGMWKIDNYQKEIIKLSSEALEDMTNQPLFLRFISLLIDDTNVMMGKSMETFQAIRVLELKGELTEKEKGTLRIQYRTAYSYVGLSKETLNLFGYLSKGCQSLFAHSSLVTRISEMANFFTDMLVGKKRKMLKVKNPQEMGFQPIEMLKSLAELYVNMADHDDWNKAVCADERAFSLGMIEEAGKLLERSRIPSAQVIGASFAELSLILSDFIKDEIDFEEEPPDEFCDPIMGSLMDDPVELPTSGVIVCRNTIARQLLVTPIDPFNRQPLALDQVIPRPELKNQIRDWKKQQREKYSKGASRESSILEHDPMD